MIDALVSNVLSRGGVELPAVVSDPIPILEDWVGIPCRDDEIPTTMTNASMEDSAPYSIEFYQSLRELLVAVWKPPDDGRRMFLHANVFTEYKNIRVDRATDADEAMSLYTVMKSVRVTRLLRHWMDSNVQGNQRVIADSEEGDADNYKTRSRGRH